MFDTILAMKHVTPPSQLLVRASYAVCRLGGAPPDLAKAELGLTTEAVVRLERLFQARPGGGPDPVKPRFADHERHVRDVLAGGGFPVLDRP
jgi:hypothetical protein